MLQLRRLITANAEAFPELGTDHPRESR
ncbi:hypothetical protein [Streptomyces sp. NPDC096032]